MLNRKVYVKLLRMDTIEERIDDTRSHLSSLDAQLTEVIKRSRTAYVVETDAGMVYSQLMYRRNLNCGTATPDETDIARMTYTAAVETSKRLEIELSRLSDEIIYFHQVAIDLTTQLEITTKEKQLEIELQSAMKKAQLAQDRQAAIFSEIDGHGDLSDDHKNALDDAYKAIVAADGVLAEVIQESAEVFKDWEAIMAK